MMSTSIATHGTQGMDTQMPLGSAGSTVITRRATAGNRTLMAFAQEFPWAYRARHSRVKRVSAMGQSRPFCDVGSMSGLPPESDSAPHHGMSHECRGHNATCTVRLFLLRLRASRAFGVLN